jgi:hypothetical protein
MIEDGDCAASVTLSGGRRCLLLLGVEPRQLNLTILLSMTLLIKKIHFSRRSRVFANSGGKRKRRRRGGRRRKEGKKEERMREIEYSTISTAITNLN